MVSSPLHRTVLEVWNGSSVDAAIAVSLCDGVHNAESMGIGGGSLIVVHDVQDSNVYILSY